MEKYAAEATIEIDADNIVEAEEKIEDLVGAFLNEETLKGSISSYKIKVSQVNIGKIERA